MEGSVVMMMDNGTEVCHQLLTLSCNVVVAPLVAVHETGIDVI